ncbi:hypothetical protein JCM16358_02490 [Halanaerocella petrolearia]
MKRNKLIIGLFIILVLVSTNFAKAEVIDWGFYSPQEAKDLIKQDININQKDKYGKTPLMWAAMINNNPEVIRLLIKAGAKINLKDKDGRTPLMHAAKTNKNPKIATTLLKNGASPHSRSNKTGKTALMFALEEDRPKMIKSLIKAGSDVNARGFEGQTPLMLASKATRPEIINLLIKEGANVNSKDKHGKTPLMWAAKYSKDQEIILVLLQRGAKAEFTDDKKKTALDYIKNNHYLYTDQNVKAYQRLKRAINSNRGSSVSKYDFRETYWGMNKEDVIKSEEKRSPVENNKQMLLYQTKVVGYNTYLGYLFTKDKLTRAKYLITENNLKNPIADYKKIKKLLYKKYGTAIKDKAIWLNDLYKGAVNNNSAIASGYLVYKSRWKTDTTDIILLLGSHKSEVRLNIEYKRRKMLAEDNKEEEKEDNEENKMISDL